MRMSTGETMSELRNKVLDVEVAEKVMGLVVSGSPELVARSQEEMRGGRYWDLPAYSSSISYAFQVQDRIAELGLQEEYVDALSEIAGKGLAGPVLSFPHEIWLFYVHASPEQRCRAALEAVKEKAKAASG